MTAVDTNILVRFLVRDDLIARAAEECGCKEGITFDKGAAKLPFFTLLS